MKLSTRSRYAIMAVVDMAIHSNGKPISLHKISERQQIALNYLEQIFIKLKKCNIVNSVRGPGGGYIIATPLEQITLYQVMVSVSGPFKMTRCSQGIKCTVTGTRCATHKVWSGFGKVASEYFNNISLQDLVQGNDLETVV